MKLPMMIAIAAAIAPALLTPSAASAGTTRAELRHDIRDVHQERHDVRRAVQSGNEARIQAERRELRGAGRELREDVRAFHRQHRQH